MLFSLFHHIPRVVLFHLSFLKYPPNICPHSTPLRIEFGVKKIACRNFYSFIVLRGKKKEKLCGEYAQ